MYSSKMSLATICFWGIDTPTKRWSRTIVLVSNTRNERWRRRVLEHVDLKKALTLTVNFIMARNTKNHIYAELCPMGVTIKEQVNGLQSVSRGLMFHSTNIGHFGDGCHQPDDDPTNSVKALNELQIETKRETAKQSNRRADRRRHHQVLFPKIVLGWCIESIDGVRIHL